MACTGQDLSFPACKVELLPLQVGLCPLGTSLQAAAGMEPHGALAYFAQEHRTFSFGLPGVNKEKWFVVCWFRASKNGLGRQDRARGVGDTDSWEVPHQRTTRMQSSGAQSSIELC